MSVHRTRWTPTHHTRQIALGTSTALITAEITLFYLTRLVIYPFTARAPYELSLTLGAQMEIVEQNSGILF